MVGFDGQTRAEQVRSLAHETQSEMTAVGIGGDGLVVEAAAVITDLEHPVLTTVRAGLFAGVQPRPAGGGMLGDVAQRLLGAAQHARARGSVGGSVPRVGGTLDRRAGALVDRGSPRRG